MMVVVVRMIYYKNMMIMLIMIYDVDNKPTMTMTMLMTMTMMMIVIIMMMMMELAAVSVCFVAGRCVAVWAPLNRSYRYAFCNSNISIFVSLGWNPSQNSNLPLHDWNANLQNVRGHSIVFHYFHRSIGWMSQIELTKYRNRFESLLLFI